VRQTSCRHARSTSFFSGCTTCARMYVLRRGAAWLHVLMGSACTQAERRLYILRDQLKVQYKATQKAQINERKEAESKRRLTSCVMPHLHLRPADTA
jgi:hypothetical protein